MSVHSNAINNNGLASLLEQAGPKIVKAIKTASASTGVNFSYLMEKASVESSFRTNVKSKTSSATGLFQFIDKTWMSMVKKYGDKYGMGHLADKIDENGRCRDSATRKQILSLRNDPEKAACLAAEYAAENKNFLEDHTDGRIGSTELYLAHFMGASGASDFLNAMDKNPNATAARIFPKAASSNHNVFFDSATGKPRSLQGVYDFFAGKFNTDNAESMVADTGAQTEATGAPMQVASAYAPIHANDIIWNQPSRFDALRLLDDGTANTSYKTAHAAMTANPVDIMLMAQLDMVNG